jgi:hypothetical protein
LLWLYFEQALAYVTLGLLCGWPYLLIVVGLPLTMFALQGNIVAISIIAIFAADMFV